MACTITDPAGCAIESIGGQGLKALADSFAASATWAVKTMMSAWVTAAPTPAIDGPASVSAWLSGRLSYLVLVVAFLSVLYAGYRMAASGQFTHLGDLGQSLFKLVVVSGVAAGATATLVEVGDAYAAWMLGGQTPSMSLTVLLGAATSPGVVIILAVVVIIAQIVQLLLMLVKNAMILALVGFLPLTAAATNTATGRGGFQKSITWLAAFVLYKPVAATIYALSFRMTDGQTQTLSTQMSGIALMVLAIFALPALMRLLVPVTASASGGNAGALAGAVVGAAVATGAVIGTAGAAGAGGFTGSSPASGAIPTLTPLASGSADTASTQTQETVEK